MLPGPEVEIDARAVLGTVEIIVPEGVHVERHGRRLAVRATRLRAARPCTATSAPAVRIRAGGALGTLKVRCKPRLVEQLRDTARRLAERISAPPPRDR